MYVNNLKLILPSLLKQWTTKTLLDTKINHEKAVNCYNDDEKDDHYEKMIVMIEAINKELKIRSKNYKIDITL